MDKNCLLEKTAEMTKQKLKEYYNSQDKLVPLFDDLPQSIDTCYVRLVLLTQQQFQERKDKISNKQEEKEDSDHKIREEDEKWPNIMDYSLIYSEQKTIKLENIWRVEKERKEDTENTKNKETEKMEEDGDSELELRHINIHGEAGTEKSVLSQRIAYLWANEQMWNDRFQLLLHIPLRKISNIFDKFMNKSNDNIQEKWVKIINELNIPHWDENDTKCIKRAKDGLLL
ncbi:Ras family protein, partial [Reticulomyxa filosa]